MFVNYSELLLPSNSSVCIAWSLDSYSQAHKIRLCFFFFWHSLKKKKNPKQKNKDTSKWLYAFNKEGICFPLMDPGSAYNWPILWSRDFDYLFDLEAFRLCTDRQNWGLMKEQHNEWLHFSFWNFRIHKFEKQKHFSKFILKKACFIYN